MNEIPTSPWRRRANGRLPLLVAMGIAQLLLWIAVAAAAEQFDPGGDFGRRPLLLVVGLLAASFLLYLASLTLVWKAPDNQHTARLQWRAVMLFAVLFRVALLWSQPIQELDLYRYLWDGRVLAAGINSYRYSPAQFEAARNTDVANAELKQLNRLLQRSPEVAKIFSHIDHRSVPTIYPPLSEAVFAATALVTPERASVRVQVGVLKGVLLLFDLATIGLVMGLLRNLGQPPARTLAYAWCPLVLKEFANTGHLDSIAVCLTTAMLWLLTRPQTGNESLLQPSVRAAKPTIHDWLASGLWAGAVLAKLYPLVLAPVLLAFWWRRMRWRTGGLFAAFALVGLGGYALLPPNSKAPKNEAVGTAEHSSFSGLGEFLRRWEMNDLLFSIVYENIRLRDTDTGSHEPWYSVLPATAREHLNSTLARMAGSVGLDIPASRLAFLFTQALAAGTVFTLACWLALRRWPSDCGGGHPGCRRAVASSPAERKPDSDATVIAARQAGSDTLSGRQDAALYGRQGCLPLHPQSDRAMLLRRAFLCLAWLWFLSATQNPWYWTWALPLVIFVSRAWLLVSGFALIYYLRFWLVHQFPNATLPGGLTGMRCFDEVGVWIEHLPPLCAIALAVCLCRKRVREPRAVDQSLLPPANPANLIVVIPALNEEASLPHVIARLQAVGLNRIRVVDNGSRDRTAAVARESGAEVVAEPRRGYGQACWTGCQNLPPDAEWILFCNADGSDDIERVPAMMPATGGPAELVLGTRILGDDGRDHLTPSQRFGNKLTVTLIRLLWGARFTDLGPLRLISRRAFEELKLRDRGFGWTVEMQVRVVEAGLRIVEVPMRNLPRFAGVSKISGNVTGSLQAGTMIMATIALLWLRRSNPKAIV